MQNTVDKIDESEKKSGVNLFLYLWIGGSLIHNFISHLISLKFFAFFIILISVNVYCGHQQFWVKDKTFGLMNWVRANLLGFVIWGIWIGLAFLLGYLFDFLAQFIPVKDNSIFILLLLIGAFCYLVGIGFYYIEKWSKP